MALTRGSRRKAWVIVVDTPRPPIEDPQLGGAPAGEVIAVFPPLWGIDRLVPIVDAYVQLLCSPADKHAYLKPGKAPYAAEVVAFGQQVSGGYNPYIEAFRVDDLVLVEDSDTGRTSYDYTRQPAITPQWVLEREREQGS